LVALLIHGGGHIMLSRSSIPPSHLALLLDQGFLPVAVDYRLCPEVALERGAMQDVLTALAWARDTLPRMALAHRSVRADGDRVVAVGWSTGGMLAMSLGWTAAARGVRAPDAILAFYSPTDYADAWWTQPVFPNGTKQVARALDYAVRDGLFGEPLTAYHVDPARLDAREAAVTGGWMALGDARSRLALHMNWRAQTLPVLTGAFALDGHGAVNRGGEQGTREHADSFAQPAPDAVTRISPRAQIELGAYTTPTCLVHGSLDDLIPVSQVRGTYAALQRAGVAARLVVVEGAGHLFGPGSPPQARDAVRQGYAFVRSFVRA
jgi:acetyl esterase/lipase